MSPENHRSAAPLVVAVVCVLAAAIVRTVAPAAESPRAPTASAGIWRALSLGHPTTAATLQWIRIVQHHTLPPPDATWLPAALHPIGALDPRWTTPWAYGALMARSHGDPATARAILREARALHPDTPWFRDALAAEDAAAGRAAPAGAGDAGAR